MKVKAVVQAGTEMSCSEAKIPVNAPEEELHMNVFGSIRGNGPSFHGK